MAQLSAFSDLQTILLATILATDSDLERLQILAAKEPNVFADPKLIFRLLLTFLPANGEIHDLLKSFIGHAARNFRDVSDLDATIDTSAVVDLPLSEIERRFDLLRLSQLEALQPYNEDVVAAFIIQWVHQLEATSGLTAGTLDLVNTFAGNRPQLQHWRDAYLRPLLLLQNDFYPGEADHLTLTTLQNSHDREGLDMMLQFAQRRAAEAHIGRDLINVVTPWVIEAERINRMKPGQIQARGNLVSWQGINEWIYASRMVSFGLAARAVVEWDGPPHEPSSVVLEEEEEEQQHRTPQPYVRYVQTILALLLGSTKEISNAQQVLSRLLDRAIMLWPIDTDVDRVGSRGGLSQASRSDLQGDRLLDSQNHITVPSEEVFDFFRACLSAFETIEGLQLPFTVLYIAEVALFGSEDKQKQELSRLLQQIPLLTKSDLEWRQIRTRLHELRVSSAARLSYGFLGRVPLTHIECELLDAILSADQYYLAKEIYLDSADAPIPRQLVKDHIVQAILNAYDNSTNGNRTRGGMKRASDLLRTFKTEFVEEKIFQEIDHLIKATHSLSFYHLTLRQGVPFQPVNVRVFEDPLDLTEKVLEQNPKSYTKLDDLRDIARNLVGAGSLLCQDTGNPYKPLAEKLFDTEHRIVYQAITAALADHDFDTAYSYITTRLATDPSRTLASENGFVDDISWRAAFAAGKYRPTTSPKSLHERINGLKRRMDLLSRALALAPSSEPLSEILATWRRSEEEIESLKSQAIEEERAFESKGEGVLPGGFGPGDRELDANETQKLMEDRTLGNFSATYEEQAPMGLFDVARGAASAFRKSAFAVNRASIDDNGQRPRSSTNTSATHEDLDHEEGTGGQHKVRRKRDVVSGIVTGGLVSGMSWVLGAQPTPQQQKEQQQQQQQHDHA